MAAGLGCGAVMLAPRTAMALPFALDSLPLDRLSALAETDVAPFAVGALVGCAVTSVVAAVELAGMQKRQAAEAERAADEAAPQMPADAGATAVFEAPREGFTSRIMTKLSAARRDPGEGVPVIARASGAPTEAEAWAEIDAFMDESPFSCDPSKSQDLYQIALAELAGQRTGAVGTRAGAAGTPAAASGAPAPAPRARSIEEERKADADAALATLDKLIGVDEPAPAPTAKRFSADARRPVAAQVAPLGASEPAATGPVSFADYSGHEAMWAEALAVFDEPVAPAAHPAGEKRPAPAPAKAGMPARRTVASAAVPAVAPACAEAPAEPAGTTAVFMAAARRAGVRASTSAARTSSFTVLSGTPAAPAAKPAPPAVPAPAPVPQPAPQDAFVDAAPSASARIDEIFNEESALIGKLKRSGLYPGVMHRHLSVVDGRTEAMPRLTAQQG